MALSAAAHHNFDKVAAGEKYNGLRAQRTDRAGEAANKAPRRQRSKAAGEAVFFELFEEEPGSLQLEIHSLQAQVEAAKPASASGLPSVPPPSVPPGTPPANADGSSGS